MANELFKDYYKRLAKEGWLRAFLCALIVGFSALFVSATVFWIIGFELVWIVAIIFVVATAGAAPIFYYAKFKPDKKMIARRIDELGLEERMLTMTELEGDDSYIAKRQREDAIAALNTVNASLIPLAISVPLIIAVAVSGIAGASMTTVSALSAAQVIQSGSELLDPSQGTEDELKEYEVVYEVEEGAGEVWAADDSEDGAFQIVPEGEDAAPVMAVPEEGWAFVEWSDGLTNPYRQDLNITENLTVYAVFGELEEGDDGDGNGDGNGDGDGDEGDGQPSEGDGKKDGDSDKGEGSGAAGKYEEINQVFDGKTFYGGSTYENAYESAMEELDKNGDYSEEEKGVSSDYLENIKK